VKGFVGPVLSVDGESLAFAALGDLWLHDLARGTLQNLTDDAFAEAQPVFSPDGESLYYVSDRPVPGRLAATPSASDVTLWRYDLVSGNHVPLLSRLLNLAFVSPSPDGKRLAAFVPAQGNPLAGQLVLVDLTTGNLEQFGKPMPPQPISWSADSAQLATTQLKPYSSRFREGVYHLLLYQVADGSVTQIPITQHASPLYVALRPDGQGVSYTQGGRLWQALFNAARTGFDQATTLVAGLVDAPSWSASGDRLVFVRGGSIQRLQADTRELSDITPAMTFTRQQPNNTWTLRAGRVVVGTAEPGGVRYLRNQDLVIQADRIVSISPTNQRSPKPVVDVGDSAVIPGLFEMHAHLGLLREAQGRTWLAYGVTSVRDPGADPYLAKSRQEGWDSGRSLGPRTHITGHLTDGSRVFYAVAEGIVDEVALDLALERTALLDLDFVKTYVRLPDHLQARVVAFAHKLGISVSSHELFPAAAVGVDHVEHIGGTSRRGYQPKVSALGKSYQDVVALLSQSGMGITATAVLPGFAWSYANDPDLFASDQFQGFYGDRVFAGYAPLMAGLGASATRIADHNGHLLRELVAADALLVTGTDSPFSPYGTGLHSEFRLFERAGLSPAQVLRAATYQSAKAAGVADELGSIEVGKLADLVVVKGDPLANVADWDNVVATVKGGAWHGLEELLSVPNEQAISTAK